MHRSSTWTSDSLSMKSIKNIFSQQKTNNASSLNNNNDDRIDLNNRDYESCSLITEKRFGSRLSIVQFWKKVISEQILLNKMQKENLKFNNCVEIVQCIQQKENQKNKENTKSRIHNFKYIEITSRLKDKTKEVNGIWNHLLIRTTANSSFTNNDQLIDENEKLRRQVNILQDKLNAYKLQMQTLEDAFQRMHQENSQLKYQIDTLEMERQGLLKIAEEDDRIDDNDENKPPISMQQY